jgi:hypothetical protein
MASSGAVMLYQFSLTWQVYIHVLGELQPAVLRPERLPAAVVMENCTYDSRCIGALMDWPLKSGAFWMGLDRRPKEGRTFLNMGIWPWF